MTDPIDALNYIAKHARTNAQIRPDDRERLLPKIEQSVEVVRAALTEKVDVQCTMADAAIERLVENREKLKGVDLPALKQEYLEYVEEEDGHADFKDPRTQGAWDGFDYLHQRGLIRADRAPQAMGEVDGKVVDTAHDTLIANAVVFETLIEHLSGVLKDHDWLNLLKEQFQASKVAAHDLYHTSQPPSDAGWEDLSDLAYNSKIYNIAYKTQPDDVKAALELARDEAFKNGGIAGFAAAIGMIYREGAQDYAEEAVRESGISYEKFLEVVDDEGDLEVLKAINKAAEESDDG